MGFELEIPAAELVDVDRLKVDGDNPNRLGARQLEALKKSIQRWGFIVPIIANRELLVADGEQRLTVARELGMRQVSVIRLPVEDVDRRLLRQVLNKLRGEHELIADAYEFQRIISAGHEDDLKYLLDLNDSQLERYLAEIREPKPEDYEIPEIDRVQTDIKRGDIYQLGEHRLMCGDSLVDSSSLLNGDAPQLIIADPPYNLKFCGRSWRSHTIWEHFDYDDVSDEEYSTFINRSVEVFKKLAPKQGVYLKIDWRQYPFWYLSFLQQGFKIIVCLVWDKEVIGLGGPYRHQYELVIYASNNGRPKWFGPLNASDVIQYKKPIHSKDDAFLHPTQMPIGLPTEFINNSSGRNYIVFDPFGGSGTTLIACEQTKRRCRMMEIDPRYCQVIINRWQAYANEKAVRLN